MTTVDLEPTDDQACQEQLERCSEDLKEARRRLEEANDALRVLMKHRDSQTREIQHAVLTNVRNLLMPSLDKFRRSELDGEQKDLLCAIISQLDEITSPFLREFSRKFFQLTHTEKQVAGMVREGRTSKEIAALLCVTENAILFHRQNIRKKLGLKGRHKSLSAHLQSLD